MKQDKQSHFVVSQQELSRLRIQDNHHIKERKGQAFGVMAGPENYNFGIFRGATSTMEPE